MVDQFMRDINQINKLEVDKEGTLNTHFCDGLHH